MNHWDILSMAIKTNMLRTLFNKYNKLNSGFTDVDDNLKGISWVLLNTIIIYSVRGTRREGNVLFKNALNMFYLRLYGVSRV